MQRRKKGDCFYCACGYTLYCTFFPWILPNEMTSDRTKLCDLLLDQNAIISNLWHGHWTHKLIENPISLSLGYKTSLFALSFEFVNSYNFRVKTLSGLRVHCSANLIRFFCISSAKIVWGVPPRYPSSTLLGGPSSEYITDEPLKTLHMTLKLDIKPAAKLKVCAM